MADVVMVATMVGFVLLCVAYVQWCDRMIGREQGQQGDPVAPDAPELSGRAPADSTTDRARQQVTA